MIQGTGSNPADTSDIVGGLPKTGSVIILAVETTAEVTVEINGDNLIESSEDFEFTITSATNASGGSVAVSDPTAFARVVDDDNLALSIDTTEKRVFEGDSGNTQTAFTVTRVGDSNGEVTVNYSITGGPAGVDDDLLADSDDVVGGLPQMGTIVIADGQMSADIIVEIIGDTDVETVEQINVTLLDFTIDADPTVFTDFTRRDSFKTIVNDDGLPPALPDGFGAGAFGDPHLVTLDGLGYDFQAVGEFTLVDSPGGTNPAFNTPIDVQVRTAPAPGSDLVSNIVAVATVVGTSSVMIDSSAAQPLLVDGVAMEIPSSTGSINVGDGSIFFDGSTYTIVYSTDEQVKVDLFDGFLNVDVFLGTGRDVSGLLGNADGDTSNEFELRDGTQLASTLEFDTLYGAYADSWRITDATSHFTYPAGQGTADFTDLNFPQGAVSLDDLPEELVEMATAAALAAGITDPAALEAAVLDFALTGDPQFTEGAADVAVDATSVAEPLNAPVLPSTFGVTVDPTDFVEGDVGATTDVIFTIYRIGDASEAISIDYAITGGIDANDVQAGTALSGVVNFAADQTAVAVTIPVLGDVDLETDEDIVFSISVDGSAFPTALIATPSATATVQTDDFIPATFSVQALTSSVDEGDAAGGVLQFEITRTGSIFEANDVTITAGPAASGDSVDAADLAGGVFPAKPSPLVSIPTPMMNRTKRLT